MLNTLLSLILESKTYYCQKSREFEFFLKLQCKMFCIFYSNTLRSRAHWPLCSATGGRVFVADPSTLGRHVAATYMLCMQTLCLWRGRATACRTLEPQTAVRSPKLENNGFLRE